MRMWSRIRSWCRAVLQRSRAEKEMDAELRFHIEAFTQDLVRSGVPRGEALRRARIEIPGLLRAHSEPIRNPVTDKEERIITVLPNGWMFHEAENASGFAKSMGAIKFDLNGRHSSLAHIAWNQNCMLHNFNEYKRKFGRP